MSKLVIILVVLFIWSEKSLAKGVDVFVIVGLSGDDEYSAVFSGNVNRWKQACVEGGAQFRLFGEQNPSLKNDSTHRDKLKQALEGYKGGELWLVMIGHGSFNGRSSKFNFSGADFTAKEFGQWCSDIKQRLVLINTASASAPFMQSMKGANRTIVTATKSANETNYTRFGDYFSEAIAGIDTADLDNDDQVSVLEAFLFASAEVAKFYKESGRIATEHALLDDNGDGMGTRSTWFEGTTAVKVAKKEAEPDGFRARQQVLVRSELEKALPDDLRQRREELETQVRIIRRKKSELTDLDYYEKLETLLMELAKIYQQLPADNGN